ncbi:MAG: hypothetical protein R3240_06195 [Gammaproteobacteria bacterium]|nr:hypothetical protein [Gammaproteobacteria bacterium]
MTVQELPVIDACFQTAKGDTFVVIGRGTKGIIVEYVDGRVELLSPSEWADITQDPLTRVIH